MCGLKYVSILLQGLRTCMSESVCGLVTIKAVIRYYSNKPNKNSATANSQFPFYVLH